MKLLYWSKNIAHWSYRLDLGLSDHLQIQSVNLGINLVIYRVRAL